MVTPSVLPPNGYGVDSEPLRLSRARSRPYGWLSVALWLSSLFGLSLWSSLVWGQPQEAISNYNEGVRHFQAGEYDQAISAWQRTLAIAPRFAQAWDNLGVAYAAKGSHEVAIGIFEEAVTIPPDRELPHSSLAFLYSQQGRLQEAVREWERVLALNPRSARAHEGLGQLHERQGDLAVAAGAYEQALAIDPSLASVKERLGRIRERLAAGSRTGRLPYVLLLASFRSKGEAEAEVSRLPSGRFPLFWARVDLMGKGRWYRVLAGRFATRQEAVRAGSDLGVNGAVPLKAPYGLRLGKADSLKQTKELVEQLKRRGYSVYAAGGYQVLLGAFSSIKEASAYAARLKQEEGISAEVVQP